jgi:DNA/RNA-binding domain of Phe-tRNA-synthetase-like protein
LTQSEKIFSVSEDVFSRFPDYVRGVVVAYGITNGPSGDSLMELLREAEEKVRKELGASNVADHPRIASWREAYRSFGAKPTKFRPSIEAMARRVMKNESLPNISALVDIGNIVSLSHLVPAGGHAIDVLEEGMTLCPAVGDEHFIPLDSDQVENPLPGEIIFVDGKKVMTRRWTWRQAKHTLVLPTTTAIEFNVDALPPVPVDEVEQACRELTELINTFCGGNSRYEIITRDHPCMKL